MAINYPDGVDTFSEPSSPETVPLSSSGDADRHHMLHHKDLGDAVEALEAWASKRTHDHSGDEEDTAVGAKLLQANTHESVDTDAATTSIHHTLGSGAFQAAPGSHVHTYDEITGAPFKICTSSTRPTNPVTGMLIYETDTNQMRVWATFPANSIAAGIYSVDYFNRVLATDLGSTYWEQTYDNADGKIGIPDGANASWIDQGNDDNRCIARRIHADDAITDSDDQVITWKTGDLLIENEIIFTDGATNDVYFRMAEDLSSYIRLSVGEDYVKAFYTTSGKDNESHLGTIEGVETEVINTTWRAEMNDRTLSLWREGEPVGTIVDNKSRTNKGEDFRGWGFGMSAGDRGFGQTTAANVDWISIQDVTYYIAVNRWTLLPVANLPSCRLRQSRAQKLTNTGTLLEWGEELEDNFGFFSSLANTQVIIREPGLYTINVAIQWDAQVVPDQAHAIVMLNGQETTLRESRFMRGNGSVPGFSQTLSLSGKIRFAQSDILSVKASYTATASLLNQIFSWFDLTTKVNSRLDLAYISP